MPLVSALGGVNVDGLYDMELPEKDLRFYIDLFKHNSDVDYMLYFNIELCKTKAVVNNLIKIIIGIGYPQNSCLLDFLFECLQDANWPYFENAVSAISVIYPRELVVSEINNTLIKADGDMDYMWVSGISILMKRMSIKDSELTERSKEILRKKDF